MSDNQQTHEGTLEGELSKLRKELFLEKELVKKLRETQKDWERMIEKVQPTIKALSEKIMELKANLHSKNQELSNVLQSLSTGLIVTDLRGRVGTFNRAAHIITGIEKQDAYQKNVNDLFKTTLLPEPIDENALEAIKEGFDTQFTMTKSDNETSVISSSTTIMESEEKEKLGIIINLNDITQIKRLEEEAERKNRLTAMGEIAMQVAHEIRNPLGSIELFISMMRMDLIEDADQLDLINHISSATRSMNHIISNLLEFTKPKPITLDTVDIHQLLTEFCEFSKFSAEQLRIAIDLDLAAESNEIMGNGELMKQVFHNIFVNACQAMPEGGHLSISTRDVVETDSVILDRFNNSSMRHNGSLKLVNITFKDTGKGMPEDTKRKVFDPFFTTREQGTGLGMSIAHNSIASHGGIILIDSVENHGTEIALLLPIANP